MKVSTNPGCSLMGCNVLWLFYVYKIIESIIEWFGLDRKM